MALQTATHPPVAGAKMPAKSVFGYGVGDFANNLAFSLSTAFLLYYYTDVAGLSAAAIGTMFLVVRLCLGLGGEVGRRPAPPQPQPPSYARRFDRRGAEGLSRPDRGQRLEDALAAVLLAEFPAGFLRGRDARSTRFSATSR